MPNEPACSPEAVLSEHPGNALLALRYTRAESEAASRVWKASCGPHALSAALGKSLEEVRQAVGPRYRGWMSPTQMMEALRCLQAHGTVTTHLRTKALCAGISRVQWEGPWLNSQDPIEAYYHTHWVAHFDGWVLCTAVMPYRWARIEWWVAQLDQQEMPYHITHHYRLAVMGGVVARM